MIKSALVLLAATVVGVLGHGRLIEPPSRSSMWRFGFKTTPNYNDNELFCGGFARQWGTNGGKCGICGDPWDAREPRPNEDGGTYGKKIVTRTYKKGQTIKVTVDLTAPHKGHFTFRLCSTDNGKKSDQTCLDQNVLKMADGSGDKFYPGAEKKHYSVNVKLPAGLTCKRCVLQWDYRTGNRWGKCQNGSNKTGCGPQETFRGCSDIAINA